MSSTLMQQRWQPWHSVSEHNSKKPPIDVERYPEILFRQGLVQTTKALATYRSIL